MSDLERQQNQRILPVDRCEAKGSQVGTQKSGSNSCRLLTQAKNLNSAEENCSTDDG